MGNLGFIKQIYLCVICKGVVGSLSVGVRAGDNGGCKLWNWRDIEGDNGDGDGGANGCSNSTNGSNNRLQWL